MTEREVPDGHYLEWIPDNEWKLADLDRTCQMKGCHTRAVAALARRHRSKNFPNGKQWWYYCESHLYGRKIEDGVVKMEVLREFPR
jgi:hypothetical protein